MEEIAKNNAQIIFSQQSLYEILLSLGIPPSYIKSAISRTSITQESLSYVLQDYGLASQEKVTQALSKLYNISYFSPDMITSISLEDIKSLQADEKIGYLPIGFENKKLMVLITDISQLNEAKNTFFQHEITFYFSSAQTVQSIYQRYFYNTAKKIEDEIKKFKPHIFSQDTHYIKNLFTLLIKHACYQSASDLYFFQSDRVGIIKIKIHGVGRIFRLIPIDLYNLLINKIVIENSNVDKLKSKPQEAKLNPISIAQTNLSKHYQFRLQLAENNHRRSAIIRILDRQVSNKDFESLNLDPTTALTIKRITQQPSGLFLVVGPTGSGKTTSLYTILKEIDPIAKTIYTIENPIEYQHSLWLQNQVPHNMTEADGVIELLNAALRCSPDVILFGEIRNNPQVSHALIDAANTGHLVFSTLHASSASMALLRLQNIGIRLDTLIPVLEGIFAQRLIRTLCPHCKVKDSRRGTLEMLHPWLDINDNRCTAYRINLNGCIHCHYSGMLGRTILYELLSQKHFHSTLASSPQTLILSNTVLAAPESIWYRGLALVCQGETDIDELQKTIPMPPGLYPPHALA